MSIDWSKAPDWAVAHGLHETGFGIKEFWLGETQHQNLEHAKSFPYGGGDPSCGSFHNSRRESFSYVTPRPALWTGEGLPPVGIDVEVFAEYSHPRFDRFLNQKVSVIAHDVINGDPVAVFRMPVDGDDTEQDYHAMVAGSFRPIRTPEQIAAEEREAGVDGIRQAVSKSPNCKAHGLDWDVACAIYDAGYRKKVAP